MSGAQRATKKAFPTLAGLAAAGLAGGTGGFLAWESRKKQEKVNTREEEDDDGPTLTKMPKRTGPMVAVYLDKGSVETLRKEFPGTAPGRLRKVVVQYNPSHEERQEYQPHFGGLATVKLTGEAFSSNRRALVASVSLEDSPIKPKSLSCAVDVTPGDMGGGPLGSAALIEQIKNAGAEKEVSWKGVLPQLTAYDREFASEEGGYDRFDEPFTLTGSICRADWMEGTTGRCRTHMEGGLPRTDGWTPQACILCNILEGSPCRDVYKRFDDISERIAKLSPPAPDKSSEEKSLGGNSSEGDATGDAEKEAVEGGIEKAAADAKESVKTAVSGEDGDGNGHDAAPAGRKEARAESEEEKIRKQELETLETEREGIALEMLVCTDHHAVWIDSNADDGFIGDVMDDDDEKRVESSDEE